MITSAALIVHGQPIQHPAAAENRKISWDEADQRQPGSNCQDLWVLGGPKPGADVTPSA
jgi:hypothetical protein